MDFILKMLVAGMVVFPAMALASDCHVVEYPDHYEAVCVGQESPVTVREKSVATTGREVTAQTTVTAPSAARDSLPAATRPVTPPSDAVKTFFDFRQQEAQKRAFRDAAKASRIRTIQGQQSQQGAPVRNDMGSKP
ncbi:MAG TPA: hypothetical protein VFY07_06370 [Geomobilimonas sp.]|nr:hypothetical protein [Geomobilimonas sp.]